MLIVVAHINASILAEGRYRTAPIAARRAAMPRDQPSSMPNGMKKKILTRCTNEGHVTSVYEGSRRLDIAAATAPPPPPDD